MLKWSVQSRRASLVDGENQVGALRLPQLFYNQDLSSLCRCVSYVQAEHWPRLIPVGKYTSAHRAGGPTPYKGWVPPARWVSAGAASPGPPTARVGLQPSRTVGGVHPPCGQDISPPAQWVALFPAHNSVGLLLIEFSQESGWLLYCNDISVEQWARLCNSHF